VYSNLKPALYQLKDLLNDTIPGLYYASQLTKTSAPKDTDFKLVEKVLKTKVINGEKFYFVKFLFYGDKFNLWVPSKNIKKGE